MSDKPVITLDNIIAEVTKAFEVSVKDLVSRKRPENIVFPRMVCFYLARELTNLTFTQIGDAFGRDHGTAIHGYEKVQDRMDSDSKVKIVVNYLKDKLAREFFTTECEQGVNGTTARTCSQIIHRLKIPSSA